VLIHPAAYDDLALDAPFDSLGRERVDQYRALRLLALELLPPPMDKARHKTVAPDAWPYPSPGHSPLPGPFLGTLAAVLIPG
jgi:hypothetical protein